MILFQLSRVNWEEAKNGEDTGNCKEAIAACFKEINLQ
jgi:hypothetical protein